MVRYARGFPAAEWSTSTLVDDVKARLEKIWAEEDVLREENVRKYHERLENEERLKDAERLRRERPNVRQALTFTARNNGERKNGLPPAAVLRIRHYSPHLPRTHGCEDYWCRSVRRW